MGLLDTVWGNCTVLNSLTKPVTESTRRSANSGLMLGQRRRRWHNIKPEFGERIIIARDSSISEYHNEIITDCYELAAHNINCSLLQFHIKLFYQFIYQ